MSSPVLTVSGQHLYRIIGFVHVSKSSVPVVSSSCNIPDQGHYVPMWPLTWTGDMGHRSREMAQGSSGAQQAGHCQEASLSATLWLRILNVFLLKPIPHWGLWENLAFMSPLFVPHNFHPHCHKCMEDPSIITLPRCVSHKVTCYCLVNVYCLLSQHQPSKLWVKKASLFLCRWKKSICVVHN